MFRLFRPALSVFLIATALTGSSQAADPRPIELDMDVEGITVPAWAWIGMIYTAGTKATMDINRKKKAVAGMSEVLCNKKIAIVDQCPGATGASPQVLKVVMRRINDETDMEMIVRMGIYDNAKSYTPLVEKRLTVKVGDLKETSAEIVGTVAARAAELFLAEADALAALQGQTIPAGAAKTVAAAPAPAKSGQPAAEAGSTLITSLSAGLPSVKSKNRHAVAVIIGNRNYSRFGDEVPDVRFAHNDARLIKDLVIRSLGYDEANVIYLEDATKGMIEGVFGDDSGPDGKLSNWIKPGKSDVFVFYSGHGAPSPKTGKAFLVPVDGKPDYLEKTGISLDTIYGNLQKVKARSVTVAIDACFSGNSSEGFLFKSASPALIKTNALPTSGDATILTATGKDQIASWDSEAKLGLFTRYLVEGLSGAADQHEGVGNKDGAISVAELKGYLSDEIAYAARRNFGRDQTPTVSAKNVQDILTRTSE